LNKVSNCYRAKRMRLGEDRDDKVLRSFFRLAVNQLLDIRRKVPLHS